MSNALEFGKALTAMMTTLKTYLPPSVAAIPDPTVGIASLAERTVGVGNWRGTRSGVVPVGLQGGRIEAVVLFQVWAQQPGDVQQAAQTLSQNVLGDRDKLRADGFLRLSMQSTEGPEPIAGAALWRQSAGFQVLYEYAYDSSDGEGLIARIPVAIDGGLDESTTITDDMARWDEVAAEPLVVRGRIGVGRLTVVELVTGASPTGAVALLRTRDDEAGPPVIHASLASFLAAVSGDAPAQHHARFVFASWSDFVAALPAEPQPVVLGAHAYTAHSLDVDPAIRLGDPFDRFEIRYQAAAFDHPAIAYVRTRAG